MYLYCTFQVTAQKVVTFDTAAFLNGMSDRTPFVHGVTLPRGKSLPNSLRNECKCYYIKPELYDIGLTEKTTTFGNVVRIYNAERTICDILRSRSRLDAETVIAIIKNYANSKDKDLNLLFSYSKKFKVDKRLQGYMEVLLSRDCS